MGDWSIPHTSHWLIFSETSAGSALMVRLRMSVKLKPKVETLVLTNLRSLLRELPATHQALLHRLDTRIVLYAHKTESGWSRFRTRAIGLNAKELARFNYQRKKPTSNQRWALATLKEEVIHYLASFMGFDVYPLWVFAARAELRARNPLTKKLRRAQRKYDGADTEIKLSPKEYAANNPLLDRLMGFLTGSCEAAEELLVDLLLARDYLRVQVGSQREVDTHMQESFPNTYALALEFESLLEKSMEHLPWWSRAWQSIVKLAPL